MSSFASGAGNGIPDGTQPDSFDGATKIRRGAERFSCAPRLLSDRAPGFSPLGAYASLYLEAMPIPLRLYLSFSLLGAFALAPLAEATPAYPQVAKPAPPPVRRPPPPKPRPQPGPLRQVTSAVRSKVGHSVSKGTSAGGATIACVRPRDVDPERRRVVVCRRNAAELPLGHGVIVAGNAANHSHERGVPPLEGTFYFGVQSVQGSNGAIAGSLKLRLGELGVGVSNTSYVETAEGADPTEMQSSSTTRMDMLAFTLDGRILSTADTSVWLEGGIGSSRSTDFRALAGPLLGAAMEHKLVADVGIGVGARHFVLEQDVKATEVRLGFTASLLSLSYRVLQFNVGPALHGPEAGLALRF